VKTAEDAKDAEVRRLDEITGAVVDAAMRIHTALGPGLLESVYEPCLNFNVPHLRDGMKRLVNHFPAAASSAVFS